ncbi:unnamed protein product [Dicrocoelium dendriticum]|nr:unnamed protein product [Dicrocoelium dendriticum]
MMQADSQQNAANSLTQSKTSSRDDEVTPEKSKSDHPPNVQWPTSSYKITVAANQISESLTGICDSAEFPLADKLLLLSEVAGCIVQLTEHVTSEAEAAKITKNCDEENQKEIPLNLTKSRSDDPSPLETSQRDSVEAGCDATARLRPVSNLQESPPINGEVKTTGPLTDAQVMRARWINSESEHSIQQLKQSRTKLDELLRLQAGLPSPRVFQTTLSKAATAFEDETHSHELMHLTKMYEVEWAKQLMQLYECLSRWLCTFLNSSEQLGSSYSSTPDVLSSLTQTANCQVQTPCSVSHNRTDTCTPTEKSANRAVSLDSHRSPCSDANPSYGSASKINNHSQLSGSPKPFLSVSSLLNGETLTGKQSAIQLAQNPFPLSLQSAYSHEQAVDTDHTDLTQTSAHTDQSIYSTCSSAAAHLHTPDAVRVFDLSRDAKNAVRKTPITVTPLSPLIPLAGLSSKPVLPNWNFKSVSKSDFDIQYRNGAGAQLDESIVLASSSRSATPQQAAASQRPHQANESMARSLGMRGQVISNVL